MMVGRLITFFALGGAAIAIACGDDNAQTGAGGAAGGRGGSGGGAQAGQGGGGGSASDGGGDASAPTSCPHVDLGRTVPATYMGSTDGLPNLVTSARLEWTDAPDDSLAFEAPSDGDY